MMDTAPHEPPPRWRLRHGLSLVAEPGANGARRLALERGEQRWGLGEYGPAAAEALVRLQTESVHADALTATVVAGGGGAADVAGALHVFHRLHALACLMEVLEDGDGVVHATREAMVPPVPAADASATPDAPPVRLSRFAFIARHEGRAVLESPWSVWRIGLESPVAGALVTRLMAEPLRAETLPDPTMRRLLAWLVAAGLADAVDAAGLLPEDRDPDRRFWDFHDALHFHRCRSGGHDHPVGASFPGRGVVEPLPAIKPTMVGDPADLIPLPVPDIAALCSSDPPFQAVVERRRSHRVRGERPIALEQLGAFLARTARVITLVPPNGTQDLFYEASVRPYPCGGAAYETEIYLAVDACDGLARGLYHYDPLRHRLEHLDGDPALIDALVTVAWRSAAETVRPQIVIHLAARMRRLTWKYRGLAWSVALKHAGVLYHAFYLAATAEGLAPCGLGAGDTELVARAYGLDPVAESPIGEFMLSSLPADA